MSPEAVAKNGSTNDRQSCSLCGTSHKRRVLISVAGLRQSMGEYLAIGHEEGWLESARICRACLSRARRDFLLDQLQQERGQLSTVEREIADKAARHTALAEDIEEEFESETTWSQHLADRVARIGGSWTFVVSFFAVLAAWMGWNTLYLGREAFDPYPYILLNLALSCVAAIQAPIIMMSQNRMNQRDRRQADQDFRINLKAEIEIASLHEKVDHLLNAQWQRMVELQQVQIELLSELSAYRRGERPKP